MLKNTLIGLLLLPVLAFASVADKVLNNGQLVGTGERTIFFVHVYDAKLYAPKGHWQMDAPFVLELHYKRDVDKEKIVDKTFESMRDAGFKDKKQIKAWKNEVATFFPDVREGQVVSQYRDGKGHTVFYIDGKQIGKIADTKFTEAYFNIWLSKKSPLSGMYKGLLKNNR